MPLLPLDMHAHVDPQISVRSLRDLGAIVFVATKSIEEATAALSRSGADEQTAWGVGVHPGLVRAQRSFEPEAFKRLLGRTSFLSEIGLDGSSRVPMSQQIDTLMAILRVREALPRLTSVHSYRATGEVIEVLRAWPSPGTILHWWLGSVMETDEAVDLGCYFSINPSSARRLDVLRRIPRDRVLTETDHPAGDRFIQSPRPGAVESTEMALARHYGLSSRAMREQIWKNFDRLVVSTEVEALLPRRVRVQLASL